ncbi:sugar phosphate isomerase/epimerase family protein [Planctomycetota bacterium]
MKIGFNMFLWTTYVTEKYIPTIETLKKIGYDGVEIPLFEGKVSHYEKLGKILRDNGLGCTGVTCIPDEARNPISAKAENRKGALEYLKWLIDCCEALDSKILCGHLCQPLGFFTGEGPTETEKKRAAEVIGKAADYAEKAGVVLAVEFLNRFECYFLNTVADTVEHVKQVNRPNVGMLFDTFHANIEEKDPVGCISKNIKFIKHIHISENDRGTPGTGHIDWPGTFKALRSGGYDGWLVVEAFGRALPDLAAATKVWRDFFESQEQVYTDGLELIRTNW